jgi:energy-coupling factor transport system ATP-binding protein
VLAPVARLVHDLGITVVAAEHRLERVVHYADRVIAMTGDGAVTIGAPRDVFAWSPLAPPVVALGQMCKWEPLPLSVRDARRFAEPLRARLATAAAPPRGRSVLQDEPLLIADHVVVEYPGAVAVRDVTIALEAGEVVALMGRNGSGKSSLLWAMHARAAGAPSLVPQSPGDLLDLTSVAAECALGDRDAGVAAGTTAALLRRLIGDVDPDAHPRDLSEGQRLGLTLAIQLVTGPRVVLLDEPTRGLDPVAKERFTEVVRELAADGRAVMIATHDVEFVAEVADRVVVMAEGEVVADGPAAEIVCSSAAFAPQVAKILYPAEWLTVAEVAEALGVLA